jgi:hypothetical protein
MSKTRDVRFGIVFKSIAGVALMLVVFSVVICAISYNGFTEALVDQYISDAYWAANIARQMIVPDMMDLYNVPDIESETDNRANILALFRRACNSMGMEFIYVIQPDTTDFNTIRFVFSASRSDSKFAVSSLWDM